VLPQVFFERALQLQGERGLKSFLKPSEIILVDGPMAMLDVDSPDDLKQLIEASHDSSHRSFNA
jgi:CTP:molybdopterin cytidylyltransferase MocA